MDAIVFVIALAVILIGAELFTNGIEWFGHRLNLGEGAVGSVLAAVATALPETLIPVIAIIGPLVTGREPTAGSEEIGVGAILGAPFTLATLAMFITGLAVLGYARRGRRTTEMSVDVGVMTQDVIFFLVAYAIAIGAAFLPEAWRWADYVVVVALTLIYVIYVRAHFRQGGKSEDAPELALLHAIRLPWLGGSIGVHAPDDRTPVAHHGQPRLWVIVAQTLVALAMIILGARMFITALDEISIAIGFDPRLFALIVAPIATELPEKFNSVLWVRTRKDTLAMGNITGAMVFQACFPTAIGILFTSWAFTAENALSFASAGAAILATLLILGPMMRSHRLPGAALLIGGPIYVIYVLAVVFLPASG
ncbi:MAG TPA: sodium:calcium antiporter [Candidatus Limnocylindria bacterium]|nr:sodium:calcium antiporter [Candidatus Limnocylindria bacterium]